MTSGTPRLAVGHQAPEGLREGVMPQATTSRFRPTGKITGLRSIWNLSDMKKNATMNWMIFCYHEGIPGHHMQFRPSCGQIHSELRKVNEWVAGHGVSSEGGRCTAERLAKDMGFYQDPMRTFGRLSGELWRACRLVVDTGIHSEALVARNKAIQYLDDNTRGPTVRAKSNRYIRRGRVRQRPSWWV